MPDAPAKHGTAQTSAHRWIWVGVFVAVLITGYFVTGEFAQRDVEPEQAERLAAADENLEPEDVTHFGFWSLAPAAVAIVLAFLTRNVLVALFLGILAGGVIVGELNIIRHFLIPSLGSPGYAQILLVYLWFLGGLIGIWTCTGGARHFSQWAARRMVSGPRSAKFFGWIMGFVFHQGGNTSTVLTGTTVRAINDRHKVSHEELSYVVDSTASPAATLLPFNVWPIYVGGIVAGSIPLLATEQEAITFFFKAIPLNFYAIFAVLFTLLLAWEKLPLIPSRKMLRARKRAREEGKLDRDGAHPLTASELTEQRVPAGYAPGLVDFLAPILILVGVAVVPFTYVAIIRGEPDQATVYINEAFFLAVASAILIALFKGMKIRTAMDGFINGCKGVTIGAIILGLATTLNGVSDSLGVGFYVVEAFGEVLPAAILPAGLMLLCMIIAFSTGTSFGTFAVMFPIAMPLAWSIHPDSFYVMLCFSAVIGGSLFGDQCSPISDTTILSSLATGCDLMDHVYTQIPLALTAAALAAALYTVMVIVFV